MMDQYFCGGRRAICFSCGVLFDTDEPYDDIDSGPEVTQTNAEIHQWP